MSKKIFIEPEIRVSGLEGTRKPALAAFNRVISKKNVEQLFDKMKVKGFRKAELIQVGVAEKALDEGLKLFDINNNEIPPEKYGEYYLLIDGQHRTFAASHYNDYLVECGEEPIEIPAIEIELKKGETYTQYINEVNYTKKPWVKEDFLNSSANLNPGEDLLQKFNELIRTEDNPSGFPLSTLNKIFATGSGLTRTDLIKLCEGLKEKGTKNKKPIIPDHNIPRGEKFIEVCRKVGFREPEIAKRYLITQFNNLIMARGEEFAFKALSSITREDITQMGNSNGHLSEPNVIAHFQVLRKRIEEQVEE